MGDQTRYCTRCGNPYQSELFCQNCGNALTGASPAPGAAPAAESMPTELPLHAPPLSARLGAWTNRNTISALVAVLALALTSTVLLTHPGEKAVPVSISLSDTDTFSGLAPQEECSGQDGYSDMHQGTQAVLTDSSGTTIATSTLGSGRFDGLNCVFHFTFRKVPKADFYALKVGFSARGDFQSSYKEMTAQDWAINVTLGEQA